MSNQIKRFTSRSAVLTYQTCHRKRFLAYHFGQVGLSPEPVDLNLLTGTCIHRGLQHLLEHCRMEHPLNDFEEACVDRAVELAVEVFREEVTNHSLNLYSSEFLNTAFVIAEHECLIEGLIRAFSIYRLPRLLEEFEILEVELDEIFEEFSDIVIWQTKADASFLFRDHYEKGVVVLSIKSASEYADVTLRNLLHDMQGVSEWVSIESRLLREFELFKHKREEFTNKHLEKYFTWCLNNNQKPKVYAVQYEHLITGKRRQDPPESGIYKRYNPLIHPYALAKMGIMFASGSAFGQKYSNPTEYKWKTGKGRQPKGWEKINIWEDMGVKEWVNWLAEGKVQPEEGNFLEEIIRTSELVIRSKEEMEEWRISTRFQEQNIIEKLEILEILAEKAIKCDNNNTFSERWYWNQYEEKLQELFPKNTQNCHDYYGKDCQFVQICHRVLDIQTAIESGVLVNRTSHHEQERLYHIERGLVK